MTWYYRRVVRQYTQLVRPLTDLLKRDNFHWNTEANDVFMALNKAITTSPILALSDFSQPLPIETDASGLGIGLF